MALIWFMLIGLAFGKDCIRNAPSTIWYGDSRSDTRIDQQSRDLPSSTRLSIDGQNGGGVVAQFSQRFGSDLYMPGPRGRVIYAGVNDCSLSAAFFDSTVSELTKGEVFSKAYDIMLNRKFYWTQAKIGAAAAFTPTRTAFGGFSTMVITMNTATTMVFETSTTIGLFMICHSGAGTLNGVALNAGIHCGWFTTGTQINDFQGTLFVSDVLHQGDLIGKGLLLQSTGTAATCSDLSKVWNDQGAWVTPNDGGRYPGDGFDAMHGSERIRAQFVEWLSCEGVDWDKYPDGYCTECEFLPNTTAIIEETKMENQLLASLVANQTEIINNEIRNLKATATQLQSLIHEEASAANTALLQAANRTKTETTELVNKQVTALRNLLGNFPTNENISTLVAKEKANIEKSVNGKIEDFTVKVQEGADQLSALAWIGVAGLIVAGVSLVLALILAGVKLHRHLVNNGMVVPCCM